MRATSPINEAPADPYIRRVAAVCDMHRVACGSVAELGGFLTALDEDKHLAMDFWAVMGKMGEEGSAYLAGHPLNERMLEVVVEAVTGQSLAEVITSSEESMGVVERLSRLLGGEDLNSPVVVDDPPKIIEEPDVEAKKPVSRAEIPSLTAVPSAAGGIAGPTPVRLFHSRADEPDRSPVEIRPPQRVPEPAVGPRPVAARSVIAETRAVLLPAATEEEQALERLRLLHWALQNFPANSSARAEAEVYGAKLSVAEVLAKYSPAQPKYAPRQPRGAEGEAPAVERPMVRSAGEMRTSPSEQVAPLQAPESGMVLGPALARVPEPVLVGSFEDSRGPMDGREFVMHPTPALLRDPNDFGRPMNLPLSDYDEPEVDQQVRIFKLVLAGVVGVGMLIGLLLAHLHTATIWETITASLQEMRGTFSPHAPPALDVPNDLVRDPAPADPTSPLRRLVKPTVRGLPVPVPSGLPRQPSAKNLKTDQSVAGVYPSFSVRNDPAVRSDPAVSAAPAPSQAVAGTTDPPPSPGGIGPLPVPGAVMEANLMVARLPTYPDAARAAGTEGRVTLQAVINKDGTVGHLRVIDGDPALRSAAMEAASKWRYRPYTVNGQPVDVSTTLAVDFRLDQ